MMQIVNVATLLTIIGILMGVTNILTQVLKQVLWAKVPSSLLAFIVAEAVTLCTFFGYCAIYLAPITWYFVVAAVVVGFMVAYAAMFGFDKLKEIIESWGIKNAK